MKPWHNGLLRAVVLVGLTVFVGCGDADGPVETTEDGSLGIVGGEVDEFGKPTFESSGWEEPGGKEDALLGSRGLSVSLDGDSLSVWEVKNAWADRDTANARAAGVAWGENSGLSWEEKYQAWIGSQKKIDALSYGETYELTTPWGKTIPAPVLECAEIAIFMRVTFASWYNLPFFMEARDGDRNRLYFGHFGIRTANGRYGRTPRFRDSYRDYTSMGDDILSGAAEWPQDAKLRGLTLPGARDDAQPMFGEDAHAGTYFDEVYLNKRTGYFMRLLLVYFGSVNLADPSNTFNIAADAVAPGDVLLERWQRRGIGHTLVVLNVNDLGKQEVDGEEVPRLEAELASGSMPRRQPKWDSPAASKRYFTDDSAGGEGYAQFGGGIKRWRSATNIRGRWTNIVLDDFADDFISSRAHEKLAERVKRFGVILAELTAEEKLGALLEMVENGRLHLRQYPASCSARIRREGAFNELYQFAKEEYGYDTAEVDRRYRKFEDYVFAELTYEKSKTCCWNSSTSNMFEIIMEHAATEVVDNENGQCQEVSVFMNYDDDGDGYQRFADFAQAMGRGEQWVAWSADESCPQANVPQDTQAEHVWTDLCSVYDDITAEVDADEDPTGGATDGE